MKRLRSYFISGLLVWIPLGLSFVVIKFFIEFFDNLIPHQYHPEVMLGYSMDIPGTGVAVVLIITLVTGLLVRNLVGQKILNLWENLLNKIPGFRGLYKTFKQVSSTVLNDSGESFKKALLIEYPRKGLWTIAFQTGGPVEEIENKVGKDLVNIYVPTTPNPTSGFFIMIPKKDVIELDMSVDAAFKLIISTGVVAPEKVDKG